MSGALVVFSTVGDPEDAERIARELVGRRLAACVNIVPGLTSVYRWKGQVEAEAELLLVIKTTRDSFAALCEALVSAHPYEVPEILGVPIESGHPPYLAWLDENARPKGET